MKLFSDETLTEKFSLNARKHALNNHNRDVNTNTLISIYNDIAAKQ